MHKIKSLLNKLVKNKVTRFLTIVSLSLPVSIFAETAPSNVGQTIHQIQLQDQFDKPHQLSTDVKLVLFAADKAGGKLIQAWMNNKDDSFLKESSTVLIVDIHRMPSIFISTIGLPLLRRYSFSMLIIKDDQTGQIFANKEGQVTLLQLSNLTIKQIEFASSVTEIETMFHRFQK
ncbi:MAG: hypothetical protein H3C43_03425 [Leptonema sp. (in: Bacteria)]|nr:hypothetical protein [Leptonema sp. (in: bacteria)]